MKRLARSGLSGGSLVSLNGRSCRRRRAAAVAAMQRPTDMQAGVQTHHMQHNAFPESTGSRAHLLKRSPVKADRPDPHRSAVQIVWALPAHSPRTFPARQHPSWQLKEAPAHSPTEKRKTPSPTRPTHPVPIERRLLAAVAHRGDVRIARLVLGDGQQQPVGLPGRGDKAGRQGAALRLVAAAPPAEEPPLSLAFLSHVLSSACTSASSLPPPVLPRLFCLAHVFQAAPSVLLSQSASCKLVEHARHSTQRAQHAQHARRTLTAMRSDCAHRSTNTFSSDDPGRR